MNRSITNALNSKFNLRPEATPERVLFIIAKFGVSTRAELEHKFSGVAACIDKLIWDGQIKVHYIPSGCDSFTDGRIKYSIGDIA